MSLEFINEQEKVDNTVSSALVDDSYSQLKGGSDQKLTKVDAFENLDPKTRETLYQTLASINEIAETVKRLPAEYRTGFQTGISSLDGPAYEMFRNAFMA